MYIISLIHRVIHYDNKNPEFPQVKYQQEKINKEKNA
jgi:hypothetical protein